MNAPGVLRAYNQVSAGVTQQVGVEFGQKPYAGELARRLAQPIHMGFEYPGRVTADLDLD